MRFSSHQYAAIRDRKRERAAEAMAAEHAMAAERALSMLGFCTHCGGDILEGEEHDSGCAVMR
ncbi:hypothetical protein AKJ09_02876 [Labilithrix luteola]|uniref:Uncharacterized protein n=1 Tax=Labilithrix luteola TaxID=1391654 RepID=A0A0K1PRS4_9BACT|nr:hypothetical protein [Labilithrix luteola]AKU96212.1 hypothetical protein AKJ09_02876 [Labilithrix luteola]